MAEPQAPTRLHVVPIATHPPRSESAPQVRDVPGGRWQSGGNSAKSVCEGSRRPCFLHNVPVLADRPTFSDYVRVIWRQPVFGLKLMAAVCFAIPVYWQEGPLVLAALFGGVVVLSLVWVPVWRHFAPRYPIRWTMGRPENLYRVRVKKV